MGDQELLRLAHLLRLCGDLARAIAQDRDSDGPEVDQLGAQTLEIASRLDTLVLGSGDVAPKRASISDRRH